MWQGSKEVVMYLGNGRDGLRKANMQVFSCKCTAQTDLVVRKTMTKGHETWLPIADHSRPIFKCYTSKTKKNSKAAQPLLGHFKIGRIRSFHVLGVQM